MANCTVRGNKPTKELMKGVSIMKKSAFKVLCMVLIIALLAPKAFAATPAPEAPLADAATVERVKQEIADGEITDMEDLFLVAYQHLGADLEEEGMTAYLNEDGTLGITQIISSEKKMTRSGEVEEFTFTTSTVALLNVNGRDITITHYTPSPDQDSGSMNGTSVGAVHTAYYNGKIVPSELNDDASATWYIQLSHMVTTITGAGSPYVVSKLNQTYAKILHDSPFEEQTKTTTGLVNGSYTYTPSVRSWIQVYNPEAYGIRTTADIYISGIATPIHLETLADVGEKIPY